MGNGAVELVLVDDRTVVREGIAALLEREADLAVVGQAPTVLQARGLGVRPRVVVTEIDLPDVKHADVVVGLRATFPSSSILVLTEVAHPARIQGALAAGADGYLLKTAPAETLLTAIRAVAGGARYLQPCLGVELARWLEPRETPRVLSQREEAVLRLLALGYTNGEIAGVAGYSIRTIEGYRARLCEKLDCHSRAELVRCAQLMGLAR